MSHLMHYPEMGEERPTAQIEASLCHYGKHWFLRTPLELKGRGIKFRGKITAGQVCGPRAASLVGQNEYYVTERAFDILCKKYTVSSELLL